MKQSLISFAVAAAVLTLFSACQKSLNTKTVTSTEIVEEEDGIKIKALPSSDLKGHKPGLTVSAPRNDSVIQNELWFQASLTDWVLQPDPGNHVHVIVDDLPYIAIRDLSQPIELLSLVQKETGMDLGAGTHLLRVFASRPQHESVKIPGASAFRVFHIRQKSKPSPIDLSKPMLAYSRPKGCNPAGKPVLLDFYLFNWNDKTSDDYTIHYEIDNEIKGTLDNWSPYQIEGLKVGTHTVRLTLVDPDGNPVKQNFSDTKRSVEVSENCPKK